MNKNTIEQVKTRIEQVIANSNPYWNISPETATYVVSLLNTYKPMRVLEIGTSIGYSAIRIAEALTVWDGELITIESHTERFEIAKKNIAETGLKNIQQVKGHAPEILDGIRGTFDLCFFDATKYEHLSYFNALKERLNPNGIIITDNMLSHEKELAAYKKTVEDNPQFENELIDIGTGLLVSRKL
ncbi:MAG: hypothetical protein CO029_04245 [Candidatus Magasanikbacteria bacterium CG_4_9_14_0_2_um_filter_41_10]|uniref:Methyltransferase n=1 Tax=Candidatus Magasanikbacteria bacterium CG_4_10_14_0_2_um_filter_41_31 TaxID=1974639 RepID=A0A2M7V3R8_9BACT|nr:MAG: hypothetical protein AUJ37_02285 [Candidatus Magasanikbacteria bacterium CG1_02_41_34]PIZ93157.1 MAG: hypothetical protein COX83_02595 [Candidatus Magasanikbacteria bacterium CG_4_10_14_0_2_um_filter_41_31]PJC53159.1 MAG: hypothetical protein CO029_04245 [Candidatus Magasanikbacteria bacterium CG_4_9_14_0_2_um_filter_41_10]